MLSGGSIVNGVSDDAKQQTTAYTLNDADYKLLLGLVHSRDTDRIAKGILTIKPLINKIRGDLVDQTMLASPQLVHKPIALRPENNTFQVILT